MDPLTAIGGAAAILQLLNVIVKSGTGVLHFIEGFRDVPEELRRLKSILVSINAQLHTLQDIVSGSNNTLDIPPYLTAVLGITLPEVQKDVEAVAAITKLYDVNTNTETLRKRVEFYLRNKKGLEKRVRRLTDSARDLQWVMNSINLSLISSIHSNTVGNKSATASPQAISRNPKRLKRTVKSRYALATLDSFLRDRGVYGGFISQRNECQEGSELSVHVGLCLPVLPWLHLPNAWALVFGFKKWALNCEVQPRYRVPADSAWMRASTNGDVTVMQQLLKNGKAGINDQTICSGKTALMVAIEAQQLASVTFLLQNQANPNIPDDDQVLPVFTVAGMDLHRNQYFEQLPPTWDQWLDVLRLLVESGASVHEIVRSRTLAGLNVVGTTGTSKVLPFLQLLAAEDALDLDDDIELDRWPVLKNVVEAGKDCVQALKLVTACGLDLNKILPDGQTILHLAAQYCLESDAFVHLIDLSSSIDMNRQDEWGWTPLHYSILLRDSADGPTPYANAVLLLRNGADPSIRGRANPGSPYSYSSDEFTCFELLEHNRPTRFKLLLDVLRNASIEVDGVTNIPGQ